jgi:hypothetical protein
VVSGIHATLKSSELAELSMKEYQNLKTKLDDANESMQFQIRQLELDLEMHEKERVIEISMELTSCANQLKKLNFQRHDVIDELFEEEAYAINLTTIKNREMICNYLQCLKEMAKEILIASGNCIEYSNKHWNQWRADSLMAKFQHDLHVSVQFDFPKFYVKYQTKFDQLLVHLVDQIDDISRWNPFQPIKESSLKWRKRASAESMEQQHAIDLFSSELSEMERMMDQVIQKVSSRWIPQMKEVDQGKLSVMKQDLSKARKTNELMQGRHAAMSFASKLSRNNYVLCKIMEFTYCLSVSRALLLDYEIVEPEVEVMSKLKELKQYYSESKQSFDKELSSELNSIRLETKEAVIYQRAKRCKELLKQILDNNYEWYSASVKELKSIEAKAEAVHHRYGEKLKRYFDYAPADNPHSMLYQELLFWPKKVEEWCIEKQEEKTKRLTDLDPKKKTNAHGHPKKPVKTVEEPQPKNVILDGTTLSPYPDPMLMLYELGVENYHVMGHLIEFDPKQPVEIVEIKPIDAEVSKKARTTLRENLMKDSEELLTIIKQRIRQKIHEYMETLERERIKKLADYESKLVNLDDAVHYRIQKLPQIHLQHQNEAKFIMDAIQDIRDTYQRRMSAVFSEIKDFQESTIKETVQRLKSCKTDGEISQLKEQFQILVDRFNFETSEEIEKGGLEFDHGKKMLSKSKLHGNHSSAWLIIKESGAYDPNTITAMLEQFKQTISEEVLNAQKDATLSIRNTSKEFEHYQQDWNLLTYNKSRLRKLRTLLKGEMILCEKKIQDFKLMLHDLFQKLKTVQTWKDILDGLEDIESIQISANLLSKYLCYQKGEDSTRTSFIKCNIEQWKQWKHDFISKPQPILTSASTTPISPRKRSARISSAREQTKNSRSAIGSKVKNVTVEDHQKNTDNVSSLDQDERWDFRKQCTTDKVLDQIFMSWIEVHRRSLLEKYEVTRTLT